MSEFGTKPTPSNRGAMKRSMEICRSSAWRRRPRRPSRFVPARCEMRGDGLKVSRFLLVWKCTTRLVVHSQYRKDKAESIGFGQDHLVQACPHPMSGGGAGAEQNRPLGS